MFSQLDDSTLSMSPYRISQMQAVRRNALALSGVCHMGSLKLFDNNSSPSSPGGTRPTSTSEPPTYVKPWKPTG